MEHRQLRPLRRPGEPERRSIPASSRFNMSTYKWHELYKAALLETDWSKIEERIQAAESAIQNRKRECALDPAGTQEENRALADAITSLGVLRSEVASW